MVESLSKGFEKYKKADNISIINTFCLFPTLVKTIANILI